MADDVRQALEEYADEYQQVFQGHPVRVGDVAPRAIDALRDLLDFCFLVEDEGREAITASCIRQFILSALTDSPDMAMEDR